MPSSLDPIALRALRNVAKNKSTAQKLVADVKKRSERMADDAHSIGAALTKLSDPALYQALGYKNFGELLKREKLMSRMQAHKLMSVAETYSKQDLKKLGFEKAYALISYVEATPAADLAVNLFRSNARIGNKYVSSMTVKAINDAAKRVRRATDQGRGRSGPEKVARTAARKLQARLRKVGIKLAMVDVVRRDGKLRLQVELDLGDAGKLG